MHAIVCFVYVNFVQSIILEVVQCAEHIADLAQSILVFVLRLSFAGGPWQNTLCRRATLLKRMKYEYISLGSLFWRFQSLWELPDYMSLLFSCNEWHSSCISACFCLLFDIKNCSVPARDPG